jgi:hypothetical protein
MTEPRTKKTFGGCNINHIRPALPDETPKAMNMVISFEDALRLHLSLGQALAKLNGYNRSTKAGKASAINLCIYSDKQRITVNESKVRD